MDSAVRNEPVTVVVTRRVKAGREADYEKWLSRLIDEARLMPGFMGTNILRPSPSGPREYTSVFRFDSVDSLQAFEQSELRARYLQEAAAYVEADAVWKKLT